MQNRRLGKDLLVSAIGLGCMGMSHAYGRPSTLQEARNIIAQALDCGYTFFDTAESYGNEPQRKSSVIMSRAISRQGSDRH